MEWDITIKEEDTIYDKEQIEQAADVANGLIKAIKDSQYVVGNRNDIAVDLCCSMWILGYKKDDPERVAYRLANETYLSPDEKEDLLERIEVIKRYYYMWCEEWENYWLMPEEWESWEQNSTQHGYFDVKYEED